MKDSRHMSTRLSAVLNFSAQSPLLADVSNFCAVGIDLVLRVSSVERKTVVFLHTLILFSELGG